jgi:VanZ family protein
MGDMSLAAPSRGLRLSAGVLLVVVVVNLLYHGHQPYAVGLFRPPWDKLAHLTLFGAIGGLLWLAAGAQRVALVVALAALLGLIDESAQALAPGRSVDWRDWVMDVLGAAAGVMICRRLALLEGSIGIRVVKNESDRLEDDSQIK